MPLGLPGAERQRVDLPRAENLRALTAGIESNCDNFLTLPGLASLYLYTGQTPPEEMSSSWMLYLTDEEQSEIVDRVADDRGLCAVVKPDLLDFWLAYAPTGEIPDRPLVRFISEEFRPLHDYSGYTSRSAAAPDRLVPARGWIALGLSQVARRVAQEVGI